VRTARRFDGLVAVVTGGASGIGRACATSMASEGAEVVLADRNLPAAQEVADVLRSQRLAADAVGVDVGDAASVKEAWNSIAASHRRADVLVNCAGIEGSFQLVEDTPDQEWEEVIRVNLGGVFYMSKYGLPLLMQSRRGAVIVNISSVSGVRSAVAGDSPYAASKAGVLGLTRILSFELAPRNIRVVSVCPGTTSTPMVADLIASNPELESTLRKLHPLGRWAEVDEIANVITFLASPEASFMTGCTVVVDGGRTQH